MKKQMRQRLAIGFTGMLTVGALMFGTVSVAADGATAEPHDVNVGQEATGMASDTHLSVTEIVAPSAASDYGAVLAAPTTALVEHRDDRT